MEKIQYKLEVFEGPMDLLLKLIGKKQVSINDVPIMEIIEQYLEYVRSLQEDDLDISSEFLEMAARLIYIKTVSLLPVHEEETEQLVEELKGELIEYRDCKMIAGKLRESEGGFDYGCREEEKIEVDMTYTRIHEPVDIFKAYIEAVGRGLRRLPPPVDSFRAIVSRKIVSVSSRISIITGKFRDGKKHRFMSFFEKSESRSEMVATFIALLAMIKAKRLAVSGESENPDIILLNGEGEEVEIDE
ncbi:MAG: segregation/condensation protein A [Clostridia bacterium]|nr:segregation/condensation protein A [Clostridia bacterium]